MCGSQNLPMGMNAPKAKQNGCALTLAAEVQAEAKEV